MTRKQELINFINNNISGEKHLRVIERIITPAPNQDVIKENHIGYKTFGGNKERTIEMIGASYSDDLIGNLPGDQNVVKILDWFII